MELLAALVKLQVGEEPKEIIVEQPRRDRYGERTRNTGNREKGRMNHDSRKDGRRDDFRKDGRKDRRTDGKRFFEKKSTQRHGEKNRRRNRDK